MSAGNKKITNKESITTPSLGSEVDQEYLKSFYPKPTKDMKWIYTMSINIQGINFQAELIMEIAEITNNNVKIRTKMGDQVVENVITLDSFAPLPSHNQNNNATGFIYESYEDVNVPYGQFKDTVKLSTDSEEGRTYLWLSKEVGPVKFGIKSGGVPATLELKEFIK